jgi:cell division protease FtsH
MDPEKRPWRSAVWIAAVLVLIAAQLWLSKPGPPEIPYSEFRSLLEQGEVAEVVVRGTELRATLKEPRDGKKTYFVQRVDPSLAQELERAGVVYSARAESTGWSSLLGWVVPLLLFVFGMRALLRPIEGRAGGPSSILSVGKSRAKVYAETDTRVTFADVAGVDEAKRELEEIVAFLKDPATHARLGARMPKGVLLVGPPGTGKTLLARALAGEASVPFFSIGGSEFVEMFVGVGAARVRDLFEQARRRAPSIIFIDELDALGRARNATPYFASHDEKEQTLNQLLAELDGFDSSSGVVILAATNRPEILDAALLRAGRFDRQVLVDRPDKAGRLAILQVHVRKIKLAPQVALEDIAALTPGFTGADLANLCNEAALAATRRSAQDVATEDFTNAIERIVAGLEKKNRLLNRREREVVAHHEIGHALIAHALPQGERVQKVSIIPRGIAALGYTLRRPIEDRYLMTRSELEDKLAVLLGGRASELLVFGQLSTGAADDLARATEIAHSMATRYGMVAELGHVAFETDAAPLLGPAAMPLAGRAYSDASAHEIEAAIKSILDAAFERARAILERNRPIVDAAAQLLLERETLTEADLNQLFATVRLPGPVAVPSQALQHPETDHETDQKDSRSSRFLAAVDASARLRG